MDSEPSYLLLNDGAGRFEDGTVAANLAAKRHRRTLASALTDLDGDGDLDLVTVNDFAGIDMHHNDGTGRFVDVTQEALDETHAFGMGLTFGDFNQDGKLDIVVSV